MLKKTLLCAVVGMACLASMQAQLAHRYNLNDVNDSVGTANGTLNGGTLANGMLTTTGTNSTDYISLPASVGTGITGNFTIQTWITPGSTDASFSTVFSLATSTTNFILLNVNRPQAGTGFSANFEQVPATGATATETRVTVGTGTTPLVAGTLSQVTLTYNFTTGLATLFAGGTQVAQNNIGAGFSFATATGGGNFNGINGHAPFANDNVFNGSTSDFRIFSSALTPGQVASLNTLGADATNAQITAAIPEPSTWMAMVAGMGALLGWQRFRRTLA